MKKSEKESYVIARADYREYGEITFFESTTVNGGYRRIAPQLVYTTHEWDDVLDLYYAKARFYDPDDKRFLSMDPVKGQITDPQSLVPNGGTMDKLDCPDAADEPDLVGYLKRQIIGEQKVAMKIYTIDYDTRFANAVRTGECS